MDFFGAQDQARRRSRRLVWAFAGCVCGVICAVYTILGIGLQAEKGYFFDPSLFAAVAILVGGIIGISASVRLLLWRSGGGAVARSLGAREVPPNPTDPLERRLRNVVEEMALASGLPVPEVYVLDHEDGINAFAAGHHPGDAAVAVTRGALRRLTRDELQGVMAHEFSHIRHGDMALNLRLAGFVFGLAVVALVGYLFIRITASMGRSRSKDSGAVIAGFFIIGAGLWLIGSIGEFFAKVLQASVSRQREFLADAAAVQFTRNPTGIINALRRIGAESEGSRVHSSHARETAHLFFASALKSGLSGLLATHPPLPARLAALDPQGVHTRAPLPPVIGAQEEAAPAGSRSPQSRRNAAAAAAVAPGTAGFSTATPPPLSKAATPPPVTGEADPGPDALASAARDLDRMPAGVRDAVESPLLAVALALSLAGSDHSGPPPLPRQPDALSGPDLDQALEAAAEIRASLPRHLRLAALELVAPAFRRLGPAEAIALRRRLEDLVHDDQQVTSFEFALLLVTRSRLSPPPAPTTGGFGAFAADAALVLATLARAGGAATGTIPSLVEAALRTGNLPHSPAATAAAARAAATSPDAVLAAADRLRALPWATRPAFLQAAAHVIRADGVVTQDEHDLLRALAHALDCPSPI